MLKDIRKFTIANLRANSGIEILIFLILAVIAYFLSLLIFPGYISPLAIHHSDTYGYVGLSSGQSLGRNFYTTILSQPRAIHVGVTYWVGMLDLKILMRFFIGITLINSALAFFILEKFYLKKQISLLAILLAQTTFFSFPGYYISNTYDTGATLAAFFLFIGIFFLETMPKNSLQGMVLFFFSCIFSVLSKENFIPALEIYAFFYLLTHKPSAVTSFIIFTAPIFAFGIGCVDSWLTNPIFLNLNKGSSDPYFISFKLTSLLEGVVFYLKPFSNGVTCSVALISFIIAALNRKALLFFAIFLMGIFCYIPYLLIPNHKFSYYWWSGMPILMLLIPVLFYSDKNDIWHQSNHCTWWLRLRNSLILVCCLGMILTSCRFNNKPETKWCLLQQDINRNIIDALESNKIMLQKYKTFLVCGINFPFHPWMHALFLKRHIGIEKWDLLYTPSLANFGPDPYIKIIKNPSLEDLKKYDCILIFNKQGKLVSCITTPNINESVQTLIKGQ